MNCPRWRWLASVLSAAIAVIALTAPAAAQATGPLQTILQEHRAVLEKSSRKTVGPVIDALGASGLERAPLVLEAWQARSLYQRTEDGLFFIGEKRGGATRLIDVDTGDDVGEATRETAKQLRPNGGVRSAIGSALVQFQLSAADPDTRRAALQAIERDPEDTHLPALAASIAAEADPAILAQKERMLRLLTIRFEKDEAARVAAIQSFEGDIGVDVRAALNPLVATRLEVVAGDPPATRNVARVLKPGASDLPQDQAYATLVEAGFAAPRIDGESIKAALIANIADGAVAGAPVALPCE